jgi:hypothetical protein
MSDPKGPGQGKGKFTRAGVQADQEARIAAIEDFLEAEFPGEFGAEDEEPALG